MKRSTVILLRRCLVIVLLSGCASGSDPSAALRIMVFNIHAGKDAAGVDNLERVAALIESSNADIVLLQEVDRNTQRSGNVDQFAQLARRTKLFGAFSKSLDYQGGEYGIAILSRWEVNRHATIPLHVEPPQTRAGGSLEPRVAAAIATNGFGVVNTHLDASREETYRLQELTPLLLDVKMRAPLLLGGDFNAEPGSDVHKQVLAEGLRDAWAECGKGQELTYPADKPVKRIDYLFLGAGARCTSATVVDTTASDHRPVLFTVQRRAP
jgi:endonuclease/exonuclease/phosphatase family metal-dependent hydrolase